MERVDPSRKTWFTASDTALLVSNCLRSQRKPSMSILKPARLRADVNVSSMRLIAACDHCWCQSSRPQKRATKTALPSLRYAKSLATHVSRSCQSERTFTVRRHRAVKLNSGTFFKDVPYELMRQHSAQVRDGKKLTQKSMELDQAILIGTQNAGETGHHFELTLVVPYDADAGLVFSDFRRYGTHCSLVTQVSGGSAQKTPGHVCCQTTIPDHAAIECLALGLRTLCHLRISRAKSLFYRPGPSSHRTSWAGNEQEANARFCLRCAMTCKPLLQKATLYSGCALPAISDS